MLVTSKGCVKNICRTSKMRQVYSFGNIERIFYELIWNTHPWLLFLGNFILWWTELSVFSTTVWMHHIDSNEKLYDIKLNLMVRLQSWCLGIVKYPFIAITPRFTWISSGITCKGSIYGLNRTLQSFTKDYY